jgi:hypothetical protein
MLALLSDSIWSWAKELKSAFIFTLTVINSSCWTLIAGGNQRTQRPQKNFMAFQAGHGPAWKKSKNKNWKYKALPENYS